MNEVASTLLNARVLIAEDNPINQEIVISMLEILGCRVTAVDNGEEAVVAISQEDFDLVLMDCQMPVMDGFQATREIRGLHAAQPDSRQDYLPIIAMTATVTQGIEDQCKAAGMDDYLSKPYDQHKLREILNKWLRRNAKSDPVTNDQPVVADASDSSPIGVEETLLHEQSLEEIRAMQSQGSPNLLKELVDIYFNESPNLLRKIKQSIESADGKMLAEAAHSLKANSSELGVIKVSELCRKLEQLGKQQAIKDAAKLLDELFNQYRCACQALLRQTEALAHA